MQPTREQKFRAHAEHLLDVFLGLREKYAILAPMILDKDETGLWGSGPRRRGYEVVRFTLFTSCVIDICKITSDKDERSLSLAQLAEALGDVSLYQQLREDAARLDVLPRDGIPADVRKLLLEAERRDVQERRLRFDAEVTQFRDLWSALSALPSLSACVTLRDKLLAHSELHHDGERYKPLDVEALGLKWGDLAPLMEQVQALVELVGHIFRQSSFAWDMLDEQLTRAVGAFWQPRDV